MENRPKIVIADTQFLAVDSLVHLIEREDKYILCGIADSRYSLVKLLQINSPDLLITDFSMFDYENPGDLRSIMSDFKDMAVLILTNQLIQADLDQFLKSGITNISLKTDGCAELVSSIDMAIRKKKRFSDQVLEMIIDSGGKKNSPSGPSGLTHSEIDIVRLISEGYTTKEIALKKHISFHTVMTHRKNIFRKLEINNVSELIMFAVRKGLIDNIEYYI